MKNKSPSKESASKKPALEKSEPKNAKGWKQGYQASKSKSRVGC